MSCTLMILISKPAAVPPGAFVPTLLVPLGVIVFIIVYLDSTRGTPLPPSITFDEEVHASPFWGAVIAVSGFAAMISLLRMPIGVMRIGVGLIWLLLMVCGLAAWSGFHYTFTPHGFEISTLGYRLRSIPKEQIECYAVEPWNFFRGYGIRGVGNLRAYVWGNRGVMIDTTQGKVYLGHSNPGQIVRDLERITNHHQGHEVARSKT